MENTENSISARLLEPEYSVRNPVFGNYLVGNAHLKVLARNRFDWTEGPVWFGDAGCLLFSDIPNNRIHRWSEGTGISTFRFPSNFANGHTRDRQGRLVSCEHGTRRVTRTEYDGSITVIADNFQGRRFNSPNDVIVKSDDSIWFTDPHYGIVSDYEGHKSEQELPCNVYRVDPATGEIGIVAGELACPNGLAFSPDETRLYVSDTARAYDPDGDPHIRMFDLDGDDRLVDRGVFHRIDTGKSDGFRLDTDGNLWSSAGDGVHCISPEGELLGKVLVPEKVSNLCFGGRGRHVMFMTGFTSLYSIALNRRGIQSP